MLDHSGHFDPVLPGKEPGLRIDYGVVHDVHPGRGTASVRLQSGRSVTASLPGSAGVDMPRVNSQCVVVFDERRDAGVLLVHYDPPGQSGAATGRKAQAVEGDTATYFDNGGHFLMGADGFVDLMAHPWARTVWIPHEHAKRSFARVWEQAGHPQGKIRYVNDLESERSFFELILDDRFSYRPGPYPNVVWGLGDNLSDLRTPGLPRSQAMELFQVELRGATSEAAARYVRETALPDGVVQRESWRHVADRALVTERRGSFGGLVECLAFHGGEERYFFEVQPSGRVRLATPAYLLDLGDAARLVARDRKAALDIGDAARLAHASGSAFEADENALVKAAVRAEVSNQLASLLLPGGPVAQLSNGAAALTLVGPIVASNAPIAMPTMLLGQTGPGPMSKTKSRGVPEPGYSPHPYEGEAPPGHAEERQGRDAEAYEGYDPGGNADYDAESFEAGSAGRLGNGRASMSVDGDAVRLESRHPDFDVGGRDLSSDPDDYAWVSASAGRAELASSGGASVVSEGDVTTINDGDNPIPRGNELDALLLAMADQMIAIASAIPAGAGAPMVIALNALKVQYALGAGTGSHLNDKLRAD